VAENRKARFNYEIGEVIEGRHRCSPAARFKSLRAGKATIAESYADARGGEIWAESNANIPEYLQAHRFQSSSQAAAQAAAASASESTGLARRGRSGKGMTIVAAQGCIVNEPADAPRSPSRSAKGKKLQRQARDREEALLGARSAGRTDAGERLEINDTAVSAC